MVTRGTPEGEKQVVLRGTPAAVGVAEGTVRVIMGPEQMRKMQQQDVLVAPFTTPLLTAAILRASAIVTETGGLLSHAAIVAREFGIPCIVGAEKATSILGKLEGQRIRVDGERGEVYVS